MDAGDSLIPQLSNLLGGVLNSQLSNRIVVFGEFVQLPVQRGRNFGAAKSGEPAYLRGAENRQDPGDDGNIDTGLLGPFHHFEKVLVVVKQLGNQKLRPSVHL